MEGGPSRVSYRVERGCVARRQIISTFFFGWRNYWVPAIKSRELHWAAALGAHATLRQTPKTQRSGRSAGKLLHLSHLLQRSQHGTRRHRRSEFLRQWPQAATCGVQSHRFQANCKPDKLGSASGWNARLVGLAISGFIMSRRTGQMT